MIAMNPPNRLLPVALAALLIPGCSGHRDRTSALFTPTLDSPASSQPYSFVSDDADRAIAPAIREYIDDGIANTVEFFERDYPAAFTVHLMPDRQAFTAFFRERWGIEETQCWWVAAGMGDTLVMLSPRVWREQACEHDGDDAGHVRLIVWHELVHVFHGQHNPSLDELEEIGWFVEGLAVHASGQLNERHAGAARQAIESSAAPARLEDGWTGKYRYGVSGSLVAYIEAMHGRHALYSLLTVTSESELLRHLDTTEEEFLDGWQRWVIANAETTKPLGRPR